MKRTTAHKVHFYGKVVDGKWVPGQTINAGADSPIPGYKTKNYISLRLWDAEVAQGFRPGVFQRRLRLVHGETNLASQLCAVLYPGDGTREGKALRLSQQYMLCSASVQDILARFKERGSTDWDALPESCDQGTTRTHARRAELTASSLTSRAWTGTRPGRSPPRPSRTPTTR